MRNRKYLRVTTTHTYYNANCKQWDEVFKNELLTEREAKKRGVPASILIPVIVPSCNVDTFFGVRQSLDKQVIFND